MPRVVGLTNSCTPKATTNKKPVFHDRQCRCQLPNLDSLLIGFRYSRAPPGRSLDVPLLHRQAFHLSLLQNSSSFIVKHYLQFKPLNHLSRKASTTRSQATALHLYDEDAFIRRLEALLLNISALSDSSWV